MIIANAAAHLYTVDELVEILFPVSVGISKDLTPEMICNRIIRTNTTILLTILKSKWNKPSKYDLLFIEIISTLLRESYIYTNIDRERIENCKSILEVYRDRK